MKFEYGLVPNDRQLRLLNFNTYNKDLLDLISYEKPDFIYMKNLILFHMKNLNNISLNIFT